jgi:hypothetical protein
MKIGENKKRYLRIGTGMHRYAQNIYLLKIILDNIFFK